MRIELKKITLLNFKGVRQAEFEFTGNMTTICGRNGSGKTTIFDAFTWLLFGKNSEDDKQFSIKTLDSDGNAIPKLEHEVSATLVIDAKTVELRRKYMEKWQKKRGAANEEFTGNTEELYYNDVPCSLKDYTTKIMCICREELFKAITNPLYFTSLKPMAQREMLIEMSGDVSNEDVAGSNKEFADLIKELSDKTLEEYRKQIACQKRKIKEEVEALPERISERTRDLDQGTDFDKFESDLKSLRAEMTNVDRAIMSEAERNASVEAHKIDLQRELTKANADKMSEEQRLRNELSADIIKGMQKANDIRVQITNVESDIINISAQMSRAKQLIQTKSEARDVLREEWSAVSNGKKCPVCGRPMIDDCIDEAEHNLKKAEALKGIKAKGDALNEEISKAKNTISDLEYSKTQKECELVSLQGEIEKMPTSMPDFSKEIASAPSVIELDKKIKGLEAELSNEIPLAVSEDIIKRKNDLQTQIDYCVKVLALRDSDKATRERIAELEKQLRNANECLTKLEGIEYNIMQFSKKRINMIEERINAMFKIVKFKMFNIQQNGGEVETCEATVDGVPFSDLNHASKINAGLDIINAICRYNEITAPVFIDNAEAVNKLLVTASQMIRLVVTEDKELTLK